jgi:hypothetical protein
MGDIWVVSQFESMRRASTIPACPEHVEGLLLSSKFGAQPQEQVQPFDKLRAGGEGGRL